MAKYFLFLSCFLASTIFAISPEKLNVPEGFKISIFANDIDAPRQMAQGTRGYIFVGSRKSGELIAIRDFDGNGISDYKRVLAFSLDQPSGVSFYNGDIYFSEIDKIWKIENIEQWLDNNPTGIPEKIIISDSLPDDEWHGWKWIAHDKTGNIFTNIGAPCNVCLKDDQRYSSIVKLVGDNWIPVARGVRNSVGFDFHPTSGEMYFGDNGRDWLGDDLPSCELNRLEKEGSHFGFPYLHATEVVDPEFGNIDHGFDIQFPIFELGAHVAPTGLTFYNHDAFGMEYKNNIFIALHGSWNRTSKVGYKLVRVVLDSSGNASSMEDFVTGFLDNQTVLGRPSAPMLMKDGSLLLSDDKSNTIFRIVKI